MNVDDGILGYNAFGLSNIYQRFGGEHCLCLQGVIK
jgi:hypothetical protein